MGQKTSSECNCQEGFFALCAPEDPKNEERNQVEPSQPPSYPNTLSERDRGGTSSGAATPGRNEGTFGFPPNPDEGGFIAPPPGNEYGSPIAAPPPREPSGGGSPPPPQQSSPNRREVTADDVLSNLEGSEEVLYGEAFASFPGGLNGSVGLDCGAMRDFLCTNSSILMGDIDMELLKVAPEADGISLPRFLHLIREFSVSDGDALSQFMGMSSNGETLAAEECRSGLMLFAQEKLSSSFGADRWDCIFNIVMWDCGATVNMEQWITYCKLTGRIVRLLRYAQL